MVQVVFKLRLFWSKHSRMEIYVLQTTYWRENKALLAGKCQCWNLLTIIKHYSDTCLCFYNMNYAMWTLKLALGSYEWSLLGIEPQSLQSQWLGLMPSPTSHRPLALCCLDALHWMEKCCTFTKSNAKTEYWDDTCSGLNVMFTNRIIAGSPSSQVKFYGFEGMIYIAGYCTISCLQHIWTLKHYLWNVNHIQTSRALLAMPYH